MIETYIESILKNKATIDDYDNWVDNWNTTTDPNIIKLELHEYLGMPLDEYDKFIHQPEYIYAIIEKRKHN